MLFENEIHLLEWKGRIIYEMELFMKWNERIYLLWNEMQELFLLNYLHFMKWNGRIIFIKWFIFLWNELKNSIFSIECFSQYIV